MTTPVYHPDENDLLAYAGGSLGHVKSVLVATHLAYCPACRALAAEIEEQCGAWLDELPPMDLDDSGLDALLAKLGDPAPVPSPPKPAAREPGMIPEPLRSIIGKPIDQLDWNPVSPGVDLSVWSIADGAEGQGSSVCLLRMAARAPVPAHHHTAGEQLLVLRGSFADEYGRFQVGDVARYDGDTDHHATADEDGECLCLFLLDGPIEFL